MFTDIIRISRNSGARLFNYSSFVKVLLQEYQFQMKALFNQLDYFVDLKYSATGSQFGDWEKLLDVGL